MIGNHGGQIGLPLYEMPFMVLRLTGTVVYCHSIQSFRCKETEKLFHRQQSRRFGSVGTVAPWKIRMLDNAEKA